MESETDRATARMGKGYHLIPDHMHYAIKSYVLRGEEPGGFLYALLSNDFMEAASRADGANGDALLGWATFLYNYVPRDSFGSPDTVNAWMESGGIAALDVAKSEEVQ